jgi:DNA-binding SARP family transcriptional activator
VIRIKALGGLSVHDDAGRPQSGAAAQPRRMAILALLAHAGDRGVTRDRILALLWPDTEEDRARNNLAQSLYALRRDLGEDTIVGLKEIRLDPDHVSSDIVEFRAAVAHRDGERAASVYAGPFLDGFHVPGAAELTRWIDDERQGLAHEYRRVLESLARAATTAGDIDGAVAWWRKLAAAEPLNARFAIALMESFAAAGDRAGALNHARIYEALLDQELDLPPDREVVQLAKRLRESAAPVALATTISTTTATPAEDTDRVEPADRGPKESSVTVAVPPSLAPTAVQTPESSTIVRRRRAPTAVVVVALLAAAAAGVSVYVRGRGLTARVPVVAVGYIAGYDLGDRAAELTAPLADLLATNLARIPGLRVVSAGRMFELSERAGTDTSARALTAAATAAARAAGATELVDGTLYGRSEGVLRLDLRRVDVATGAIADVRTVEGANLFALVDSGTARLATRLGSTAPTGSVADVTTRSLAAFRLYAEGMRRLYAMDGVAAHRLLSAAVAEDSTFAMATYYWAITTPNAATAAERMARAMRLSATASDRERLTIRAGWAFHFTAPELGAIADTLATRYPDEVDGHFYRGAALVTAEDYLVAVPYLRRAIELDSLAVRGRLGARMGACPACEARGTLVFVYLAADSLAAAERESQASVRAATASEGSWVQRSIVLDALRRPAAALAALDSARQLENGGSTDVQNALAVHWLYVGDYTRAEELERVRLASASAMDQHQAHWYLAIALRDQGRVAEALAMARRFRAAGAAAEPPPPPGAAPQSATMEGVILDAMGQYRAAAALFDSLSRWRVPGMARSQYARNRVWMSAHAANARAAAADTAGLSALADTMAAYGVQSAFGRDQRLHHAVRGLILAARGDDKAAVVEYRSSIRSPTTGYTRTNVALARSLLRLGRSGEAVVVLQAALRGGVEASPLYASRTEIHELLARAWQAAGRADSAVAHFATVARVWSAGDPPYRARAAAAAARVAAISHR